VAETSGGPERERDGHPAGAHTDPYSARAAVSRAKFLSGATVALGAVIGAAVAIPTIGFVLGPSFQGEDWYWVNLGPADNETWVEGSHVPIVYTRTPDGGNLERRVAFVRRNNAEQAQLASGDQFTIISNTCMHLGCPVVGTSNGFGCPCHGGNYDAEGRRIAGPPIRPLNRFEHHVGEDGNLYIGRVFATKEENGQVVVTDTWKDPGQPTSGLLSILYPPPPR
jgi:menaquinol-cytochrome c reductase iron-sulfur subunit